MLKTKTTFGNVLVKLFLSIKIVTLIFNVV